MPKNTLLDAKTGLHDLTEVLDCCRATTRRYEDGEGCFAVLSARPAGSLRTRMTAAGPMS